MPVPAKEKSSPLLWLLTAVEINLRPSFCYEEIILLLMHYKMTVAITCLLSHPILASVNTTKTKSISTPEV